MCTDQLKRAIHQLKRGIDQLTDIFYWLYHTFETHVRKDKAAT